MTVRPAPTAEGRSTSPPLDTFSQIPPLLAVRGLTVRFRLPAATVHAVTDATFDLHPGECLALVGESGSGKSVMAHALLGLLPANAEVSGRAHMAPNIELIGPGTGRRGGHRAGAGVGAGAGSGAQRRTPQGIRGRRIGLVPQSPVTHLTPVRTIRSQLHEVLGAHGTPRPQRRARADELSLAAGLAPVDLDRYPHELSGGMAQRAATALALAGDPEVLLADEPTSGLDRILVDQTMDLLRARCDEGRAVLLVTHDLRAAEKVADTVAVMYASRIVELAPAHLFFADPQHPWSQGLLEALPDRSFTAIPGCPPSLTGLPEGCAFAPRCEKATNRCVTVPLLEAVGETRVACHERSGLVP